jgi:hypothetical protein
MTLGLYSILLGRLVGTTDNILHGMKSNGSRAPKADYIYQSDDDFLRCYSLDA